jgi:Heparinase II/III-like protein
VIHRRRILFVANEYWLIEDELDADGVHRYDLRFHLTPDQQIIALDVTPTGWRALTPRVSLIFAGDANARVESGWVSAEYGVKRGAPVVTFTRDGAGRTRFVTLVAPVGPDNEPPPDLHVRFDAPLAVADVTRGSKRDIHDRIRWTLDGAARPIAGNARGAIASWVRCSSASSPQEVTLSPADVVDVALCGPTASDGADR